MNTRNAWDRGVKAYALEMLESFEEWRRWNEENGESVPELDERTALNGASDWSAWAYGGCGLVYNAYIAERLCTPSELRKLNGGAKVPTGAATWCDIEARAARQAWRMIAEVVRVIEYKQVKVEAVEGLQKLHGISEAEAVEQFGYIIEA
jgi:hypothetical protein